MKLTVQELCLTCLSKSPEMHSLNEIISDNLKILEILKKLVPYQIDNQQIPFHNSICKQCVDKLIDSYTFQKQCLNAIQNLNKLWKEKGEKTENKLNVFKKEISLQDNDDQVDEDETAIKYFSESTGLTENPFEEVTMDSFIENKREFESEEFEMSLKENAIDFPDETDENVDKSFKSSEDEEYNLSDELVNDKGLNDHTKPSNVSNQCKYCPEVFKKTQDLASHMFQAHNSKPFYQCDLCDRNFYIKETYTIHRNWHLGIKTFECQQCGKAFGSNGTLNQHLVTHSNNAAFSCHFCERTFNRASTLKVHLERHGNKRPYKCSLCPKRFKVLSDHIKHKRTHSKKRYKCKICDLFMDTTEAYNEHHQVEHGSNMSFKCSQCSKGFSSRNILKRHERSHKTKKSIGDQKGSSETEENQEKVQTSLTDTSMDFLKQNIKNVKVLKQNMKLEEEIDAVGNHSDNKHNLKVEIKELENQEENEDEIDHNKNTASSPKPLNDNNINSENDVISEDKTHQCKLCLKTFKQSHGLNLHITKKHLKTYLFNCDKCDKGFMQEEFYIKHQNRHLGIKTHKCKQCGKAFDANSTLNQHLISHSKETPYLCTFCGKSFNRSGTLRQHMLRHGDATPFVCTICGKKFKCYSDHSIHMSKHTPKRVYDCEICGKRFTNSTSVKHHKLVHSGEKPFKCDLCDKSFNSSSNMKCHRRIHTGEKPYNCPYCPKTFRQSYDTKKHAMRMHPKEMLNTQKELLHEEDEKI